MGASGLEAGIRDLEEADFDPLSTGPDRLPLRRVLPYDDDKLWKPKGTGALVSVAPFH
jgi:hypothetical protein